MQSLSTKKIKLLSAVTSTAAGVSLPIATEGRDEIVFYVQGDGTTSGGTMKIEEAMYDPADGVYSGTWSQIGSDIAASGLSGQSAYHVSPNAYGFVRFRISGAITGGGTVTVWAVIQ